MTSPPDYDVIIAGGGLAGSCLALGLARENLRVALVEAVAAGTAQQRGFDDKGLALSLSSRRILDGLGLWQSVSATACPVEHIHVSDKNHFGCVRLHADDLAVPALGYVVLARDLGNALTRLLAENNNARLLSPAVVDDVVIENDRIRAVVNQDGQTLPVTARLLVTADGTQSSLRGKLGIKTERKDYAQTAIVSNIAVSRDHRNTAYERFTAEGPLALLPMPDGRYAVVFTTGSDRSQHYMDMTDEEFLQQLQQRFGYRAGRFRQPGKRKSYPLQMLLAREQVRQRLVVLGNAAHTIHPNGAQGFNLCLRDIAGLLDVLLPAQRTGADIGDIDLLQSYVSARRPDQRLVERFTDAMATIFYSESPHKIVGRNSAMLMLDLCPPLKRTFMQHAMGITGRQPSLVRNSPV